MHPQGRYSHQGASTGSTAPHSSHPGQEKQHAKDYGNLLQNIFPEGAEPIAQHSQASSTNSKPLLSSSLTGNPKDAEAAATNTMAAPKVADAAEYGRQQQREATVPPCRVEAAVEGPKHRQPLLNNPPSTRGCHHGRVPQLKGKRTANNTITQQRSFSHFLLYNKQGESCVSCPQMGRER